MLDHDSLATGCTLIGGHEGIVGLSLCLNCRDVVLGGLGAVCVDFGSWCGYVGSGRVPGSGAYR